MHPACAARANSRYLPPSSIGQVGRPGRCQRRDVPDFALPIAAQYSPQQACQLQRFHEQSPQKKVESQSPESTVQCSRSKAVQKLTTLCLAFYRLLPTAYCLLPTAYCLLPTAFPLPTTDKAGASPGGRVFHRRWTQSQ